jgi:hypothetical protein
MRLCDLNLPAGQETTAARGPLPAVVMPPAVVFVLEVKRGDRRRGFVTSAPAVGAAPRPPRRAPAASAASSPGTFCAVPPAAPSPQRAWVTADGLVDLRLSRRAGWLAVCTTTTCASDTSAFSFLRPTCTSVLHLHVSHSRVWSRHFCAPAQHTRPRAQGGAGRVRRHAVQRRLRQAAQWAARDHDCIATCQSTSTSSNRSVGARHGYILIVLRLDLRGHI